MTKHLDEGLFKRKYSDGDAELTKSDLDSLHSEFGKAHHSVHTQKAEDHEKSAKTWFHVFSTDNPNSKTKSMAGRKQLLRARWHRDQASDKKQSESDQGFLKEENAQFRVYHNEDEIRKIDGECSIHNTETQARQYAKESAKSQNHPTFFLKQTSGKGYEIHRHEPNGNSNLIYKVNDQGYRTHGQGISEERNFKVPNVNRLYESYAKIYRKNILGEEAVSGWIGSVVGGALVGKGIEVAINYPDKIRRKKRNKKIDDELEQIKKAVVHESVASDQTSPKGHKIRVERVPFKGWKLTFLKRGSQVPLIKMFSNKDDALRHGDVMDQNVNEGSVVPFKPKPKPMGGTPVDDSLLPPGGGFIVDPDKDNVEPIKPPKKPKK